MTFPSTSASKAVVLLAPALPWLNPFATGPSPQVVQSLVTLLCLAVLLLVFAWRLDASRLDTLAAGAWLGAAVLSW